MLRRQATSTKTPLLQRKCSCNGACNDCAKKKLQRSASFDSYTPTHVPAIVHDVLRSSGRPLDSATRRSMEAHFAHDFSSVRTHSDSAAATSAQAVGAEAYTVGRHIVFGAGPVTPHILAHELAHVVQNGGGDQIPTSIGAAHAPEEAAADRAADNREKISHLRSTGASFIRRYRSKKAFNFGVADTSTLVEQEFVDAKKQPWIERVDVHFNGTAIDNADEKTLPAGTATAHYAANKAKLPDISVPITGGNPTIGFTDRGTFSVTRIEGVGYNDQPFPDRKTGEGPNLKYAKPDASGDRMASMHYAVFFHGGQALHIGDLNRGSHGCVHFGSGIQQINYHSVVAKTKVAVTYDAAALAEPCCERMTHLGVTKKGGAPNPCDGADPKACSTAAPGKGGGK